MLVEDGGNGRARRIPDTLQALIAARIDRLQPDTKRVLQRASIVGRRLLATARSSTCRPSWTTSTRVIEDLLLRDFIVREVAVDDHGRDARTGSSTC